MKAKILIADSVDSYRSVVSSKLIELGYEITEASDAKALKNSVQKGTLFDVVVVDNMLSDQLGSVVIPSLREAAPNSKIVWIVEPMFEMERLEDFCSRNTVSRLINGPIHPKSLVRQIELQLAMADALPSMSVPEPTFSAVAAKQRRHSIAGDSSPEKHLLVIRRSYQEKLPHELEKLENAIFEARKNPDNRDTLKAVHRLAHTLHGTAGTLGFAEISRCTADIESVFNHILAEGIADESVWDDVISALNRAQTAPERTSLLKVSLLNITADIATVLIIDKNAKLLEKLEKGGKENLINVLIATTPDEALDFVKTVRLDGIIVDIDFEEDFTAFAQNLRSSCPNDDLPMAIMADVASISNRTSAAHVGASQFLVKPFNVDELVDVARIFTAAQGAKSSKILIVDDDHFFREHVAAILEHEGMEVTAIEDPEQVIEEVELMRPDIVLLDVVMPRVSGFDVCRMLRSSSAGKDLPILFLTAESSPEVRLQCFKAGGDDYIEKPVIKEELLARIDVRLERIRMFKDLADKDTLTGLPNRRAFLNLLKLRLAEGKRYERPLALCLLDIDKFKHVNDTYGHLAGDRVLAGLGKLLMSRFRDVDIRGRWGGEEFVLAFYGESPQTARLIVGRVLDEFSKMTFEGDNGEEFQCTFSGGVAVSPDDGSTTHELFRLADERLYEAKEAGRNRIVISKEIMD